MDDAAVRSMVMGRSEVLVEGGSENNEGCVGGSTTVGCARSMGEFRWVSLCDELKVFMAKEWLKRGQKMRLWLLTVRTVFA